MIPNPPPIFEPYMLTPFDYLPPPLHMTAFLTFILDNPARAIPVLEAAVERLINELPFLTGNVNVREVQPSTAAVLDQHPMLVIKHHPRKYISSAASASPVRGRGQTISYDDIFTEEYLPLPLNMGSAPASPVYRFQANILEDGIILCGSAHHNAVDGMGQCFVLEALATCSREVDITNTTITNLLTTLEQEKQTRNLILQAASAGPVQTLDGQAAGQTWGVAAPPDVPNQPISRKLIFSPNRISQLKTLCSAHLPSATSEGGTQAKDRVLSRNDLVLSLIWLCVMRARARLLGPAAKKHHSSLSTAIDVRAALRPPLPRTYIGNAVHTIPLHAPFPMAATVDDTYPYYPDPLDPTNPTNPTDTPPVESQRAPLETAVLTNLTQLALLIRRGNASVDSDYLRQHLAQVYNSPDWSVSAASRPAEFGQSSLRSIGTYRLDFGSVLGRVRDFDVPDPRFRSAAWILPARGKDAPWEVRLVLEPEALALVKRDPVVRWAVGNEGARL
ncbi:hypothetical protein ASPACDRAFT_55634 [Aspergillus aculeatus ATCC 16872]|uniref:Uncharacterized protein n=1 Tax=Aspergillus aculeatus (strain ATCC 16872 / CBS 172.66 / WB 5094) TaxID=690307 RepID=A0A1L9WEW7_ASPA1|nr:uncharacterized protein ASPACDRAFT_55634 [Aspergillus aculeatus ATCC 16872]OJJ94722.1 hypothetical protein ASPACDRAFT_55634 [Aspergillus aculeatus ATCC 16872]